MVEPGVERFAVGDGGDGLGEEGKAGGDDLRWPGAGTPGLQVRCVV